jgi:L-arabinokinase
VHRFDDELLVTRAPGRLDVMGGIADYSGSLVLQMPIAEACHVALQLHPLQQQRVWKHVQVCVPHACVVWLVLDAACRPHSFSDAVALVLCPPPQARHDKLGGPRPTLLVVSLHADDTNRAPTFDIDLDDLFNPDGECVCAQGACPAPQHSTAQHSTAQHSTPQSGTPHTLHTHCRMLLDCPAQAAPFLTPPCAATSR